ncbi:TIGR04066 family peptide maturation system protein [Clostridium sp. BNL1100]|uniref:TIGR04066 family peptide maturation system protein n=1 Tax=Clostridium sp. BNL1100 TaxID=755731 RepID=UPI00024A7EED|nr:TIGR04066 family peptide maturation system protein [Clostridium sp. BNL1100]AEY65014.1 peptide maturation system protein, TIGR04066 family [Clostridium sp. BNL1100]
MKNQKVLIYPYDSGFTPLLRHKQFLDSFEITSLVSPGGWGLTGRDAGDADKSGRIGINVTADFDEALELCDIVMIVDSEKYLDFQKYMMPKVFSAVDHGKDIIITTQLRDADFNTISKKCKEAGVNFKYFNYPEEHRKFPVINVENEFLYNINTPVVFVLGIGERTSKFEIQLSLREKFCNEGYRVSQIGTRGYCELLGFHSFPEFMFNGTFPETNKIVFFNHLIKKIEDEEHPDVIIIGIPGGIMPFNNRLTNKFGILAYEVSQALPSDSAIFSCHYAEYDNNYFKGLSDLVKYKLGFEVSCYNISNVMFDWTNSKQENKIIYTTLDSTFIGEKIIKYAESDLPVFNAQNTDSAGNMSEHIINKLADYGNAQCV